MTQVETTLMEFEQLKAYVAEHDLEDQMVTRDGGMTYDSLVNIIECSTGKATITVATEEAPPLIEEVVIEPIHTLREVGELSELIGWNHNHLFSYDDEGFCQCHLIFDQ